MTAAAGSPHRPVLLAEVLAVLAPRAGKRYVDATFGAGGYSRALLEAADCAVIGIDRDPTALALGAELARRFPERLTLIEGRFGDLAELLAGRGIGTVDGVVFDLGVSSMHLDTPERGFSFRFNAPLDMRMGADGPTAADLLNTLPEIELARILFEFGEERRARRVAAAIVTARQQAPIQTTGQLASLVRSVVPAAHDGIDPATRTFQALRVAVNEEDEELRRGLLAAERVLNPGGRLAVVAFHSLEDRVIKDFMRRRAGLIPGPSRHQPGPAAAGRRQPTFQLLGRRPVTAGEDELSANPRARSAKLRAAERTSAPPAMGHGPETEVP
jgi:16S rRNA (cytosine1402-N4)-methyltransferase